MNITETLKDEAAYLNNSKNKSAISINTTAKHASEFLKLPRREANDIRMSNFMINEISYLKETLCFFDGKVDYIYIDIEPKQKINLFKFAKNEIHKSKLIAIKPNDITLEACDLLIRNLSRDNLVDKNVLILGTGNLSTKIALRLAERQANIYIKGRNEKKESIVVSCLNQIIPLNAKEVKKIDKLEGKTDYIVSFLSGLLKEEQELYSYIYKNTKIIDGGINNFSSSFVKMALEKGIFVTRLDTRISLPYQFLNNDEYVLSFFSNIYGKRQLANTQIVAGGCIGEAGSVIVDNIKNPTQIIGVADGSGGVKKNEQLTKEERESIIYIKQAYTTIC